MKINPALVCLALALPGPARADEALLAKARAAYADRLRPEQAKAACDLFKQAADADAKDYAARWEGSRALYYYGEYTRASGKDDERLAIFQDGIDRAKAALALKPKGAEAHFWLGVHYGVFGETKGIFKSLSMVPLIKEEMAATVAVDPGTEAWGADRVLGRLMFRLPWFKGGDDKKSAEHLERSLAGAPTNELTKLYLAETYKSLGEKDKAIALLKKIVDGPTDPQWAPEHPVVKAKAEKLLRKWQ